MEYILSTLQHLLQSEHKIEAHEWQAMHRVIVADPQTVEAQSTEPHERIIIFFPLLPFTVPCPLSLRSQHHSAVAKVAVSFRVNYP